MKTSKGHVAFIGEHEYFIGPKGALFRAPIARANSAGRLPPS